MPESWKPVTGYEGVYEVSSLGRVKRILPGRGSRLGILTPKEHGGGYLFVTLCYLNVRKHHTIHRLVAEAFLPVPSTQHTDVNHKDGDKANNGVSNLEWMTKSENAKHAQNVLHVNRKLSDEVILDIRERYRVGEMQKDIASRYGLKQGYVSLVVRGKVWKELPLTVPRGPVEVPDLGLPEEWRKISRWPEYSVSDKGRVRRDVMRKGRQGLISIQPGTGGYAVVMLSAPRGIRRTEKVHRLVTEAFKGKAAGMVVNHINGKRSDNRIENLEWSTHRNNMRHAFGWGQT